MTTDMVTTKRRQVLTLRQNLERSKSEIERALPQHVKADYMMRVVMTSIQNNPKLLDCDPKSVLSCVMQCAQIGLAPDGVLGQAYLIPYEDRRNRITRCNLILGYKGLCELARRSGEVTKLYARVVHEGDQYKFAEGIAPTLEHVPAPKSKQGEPIAYYAVGFFRDASTPPQFVWMWREDVEAHRDKFALAKTGPWRDHFDAMACKTVLIKLCNELPKSRELQKALEIDQQSESRVFDVTPELVATGGALPGPDSDLEDSEAVDHAEPDADPDADPAGDIASTEDDGTTGEPEDNGRLSPDEAIEQFDQAFAVAGSVKGVANALKPLDRMDYLPDSTQEHIRELAAARKKEIRESA